MNFNKTLGHILFILLFLMAFHLHGYAGLAFTLLIVLVILDIVHKAVMPMYDLMKMNTHLNNDAAKTMLSLRKRIALLELDRKDLKDKNGNV